MVDGRVFDSCKYAVEIFDLTMPALVTQFVNHVAALGGWFADKESCSFKRFIEVAG